MSSQRNTAREARPDRTNLLLVVWVMVFLVVGLFGSYEVYTGVRETVANWETTGPFQPNPTRRPGAPLPSPTRSSFPIGKARSASTSCCWGLTNARSKQGPWRTDTMILVTIDPATKSAGMLSIPRDLWVPIPGYRGKPDQQRAFYGRCHQLSRRRPGAGEKDGAVQLWPARSLLRPAQFHRVRETLGLDRRD